MSIIDSIRKDMFEARKNGLIFKSEILGMSLASIKNAEIEKGKLSDDQVIEIIRKDVKKLDDAYKQYLSGGREDLANKEKEQMDALNVYLPLLMGEEDIRALVNKIVEGIPSATIKEMGMVMGIAMKELKGKADGTVVNKVVKEILSGR